MGFLTLTLIQLFFLLNFVQVLDRNGHFSSFLFAICSFYKFGPNSSIFASFGYVLSPKDKLRVFRLWV